MDQVLGLLGGFVRLAPVTGSGGTIIPTQLGIYGLGWSEIHLGGWKANGERWIAAGEQGYLLGMYCVPRRKNASEH
jgi:hypothetical protein